MPNISTLDLCRQHLFTAQEDIIAQFDEAALEHNTRVRDMYMWRLANPDAKDRQFVDEFKSRYPMRHDEKYLLINHGLARSSLALLRGRRQEPPDAFFNRTNNEDLILAIQSAGVSRGRNGFFLRCATKALRDNRKDKSGEKLA